MTHVCGNSCFCRVHGYALYFCPEREELPEAGEHACIIPDCKVWKNGDRGAILANERAGYVCTCEASVFEHYGHKIEGYEQSFHFIAEIVHKKTCLLFAPPCFDCFGYGDGPQRLGEVMGTLFRCPFHDRQNQSILERLGQAFVVSPPGIYPPDRSWAGIHGYPI